MSAIGHEIIEQRDPYLKQRHLEQIKETEERIRLAGTIANVQALGGGHLESLQLSLSRLESPPSSNERPGSLRSKERRENKIKLITLLGFGALAFYLIDSFWVRSGIAVGAVYSIYRYKKSV